MPGIQPCDGGNVKVCPPGTDFAGMPTDDLDDCNRDEVGGEVITNPEVCPSGPFKGMPVTNPRDCLGPDDQVLPNVIRREARPEVEAETTEAGGVLPFTGAGAGAGSVLPLIGAAAALIAGGTFAMRIRRKR